jgi:hypothetical protein
METLARLIDARVLEYVAQPEFESLYKLIRQTEQALNGFMSYIRRQRAGSQEYGDRKIHEDQADYDVNSDDQNSEEDTEVKAT